MPVVWSPTTRAHDPQNEVWVGVATIGTEVAARVDAILTAVTESGHPLIEATAHPDDLLARVHEQSMLTYLAEAAERWRQGPYVDLVGQSRVVPYLFPTPAMTAGLPTRPAVAIHAEAGTYAYDTMTLVGDGTWEAARAAVDCALTAADLVVAGERAAYALCRPPGHHATPAGFGGSCYLNNAAVAAEALRAGGHDRVAVIDIDAHQGNGTAAIFYDRGDVLYGSVHVDPAAGWFPHIVGYADETGTGDGAGAPATGRCRREPPTAPGWRRSETWPTGWSPRAARPWWSPWASTPPSTTPRARSCHRRRLPVGRIDAGRHRAAGRRRPGGRLPPADPREPGRGVPRRARGRRRQRDVSHVSGVAGSVGACHVRTTPPPGSRP